MKLNWNRVWVAAFPCLPIGLVTQDLIATMMLFLAITATFPVFVKDPT